MINVYTEFLKIKNKKKPRFAAQWLTYIYGLNVCRASKLMAFDGLSILSASKDVRINVTLNWLSDGKWPVDRSLKIFLFCRLWFLWRTRTYRGMRQKQGLPSRGQRTHANAGTPARMRAENKLFPFSLRAVKFTVMSDFRNEKRKKGYYGNKRKSKTKMSNTKAKKLKKVLNIKKKKKEKKIRQEKSRG